MAPVARVALFVVVTLAACLGEPTADSEREVRRVWDEYLASKNGQFAMNAGTPSPLWSSAEQSRWPMYDLAGFYLPDGAAPEVASITPVNAAADTAYEIVTRFRAASAAPGDSLPLTVMAMTVYARREGGRWVLANALPYKTDSWARETRGRIEYRVAPGLSFNAPRADRAAAFVDSLSVALGVTAPRHLDYYVTESVDQALAILGVEMPERYGAEGGFSKPVNAQVFSGIPALGEDYRHELAHVVLLPIVREGSTTLLASEGVPTWLGGTAGRDFAGSVRHLDSLLVEQPTLDLGEIVDDMRVSSEIRNAAGAVLAQMINEAGGNEAVREYLQTPGRAMRSALERLLRRPWRTIEGDWRRRVREIAAG